jgi:UDP-hydrolysing UDP-N-acetyl-D-glucosamine 2-epimerase
MTSTRHIAVVTGSRADFGLLRSVLRAIDNHDALTLQLIVTGTHLFEGADTMMEIGLEFSLAADVVMQVEDEHGRDADAQAVGRGVSGFSDVFYRLEPDVVVVLGDRIEAFAAAAAASVGGLTLAHLHGGDRAEGIADEAMRHAITKLAHVHFPATEQSAERIKRMGEDLAAIHVVGSPAADGLDTVPPLGEGLFKQLGSPRTVFLMHGVGLENALEERRAATALEACAAHGPVLAIEPNTDAGSQGVHAALAASPEGVFVIPYMPREEFIGALKRVDAIVGNSSAGLIEAAVVGCAAINVGTRQRGRERASNVIDVHEANEVGSALQNFSACAGVKDHPFGDGSCGVRIAALLASIDLSSSPRKCNAY